MCLFFRAIFGYEGQTNVVKSVCTGGKSTSYPPAVMYGGPVREGSTINSYLPTLLHSVESFCISTMYSAFCIHLEILRNHKLYRVSLDSPKMDGNMRDQIKSFIQGTLSQSKDDLWAVMLYTNYHCQWCLSVRDREKEIETGEE